jgi:hypothetical protein
MQTKATDLGALVLCASAQTGFLVLLALFYLLGVGAEEAREGVL